MKKLVVRALCVFVSVVLIAFLLFVSKKMPFQQSKRDPIQQLQDQDLVKKVVWMNVFVHGTFGTIMGLLSLPNVLKDEIHGTTYRGVNKGMRDNSFFFQAQAILERGLQPVAPSFTLPEQSEVRYAAFPILKAFDEFAQFYALDHAQHRYYTFGWSGLISQQRRRSEAIRLYNALQEEAALLIKQGFEPKIRLIAHSHGGNLCLNLGALPPLLNAKTFNQFHKYSLDPESDTSFKKMFEILKKLPNKELAALEAGQKKLDYVPVQKNLVVDELIMLGTPLQAETEFFLASPVFKAIFSVYSEADTVQKIDWISTKQSASKQRAELGSFAKNPNDILEQPRVVQVKITYERAISRGVEEKDPYEYVEQSSEQISFLDSLLGVRPPSKDPNHHQLWFLEVGDEQAPKNESFLSPLPTVIFLPAILSLLEKNPALLDVAVNFTQSASSVDLFLTKYDQARALDKISFPLTMLQDLKKHITPWLPQRAAAKKEFNIIYQLLTHKS